MKNKIIDFFRGLSFYLKNWKEARKRDQKFYSENRKLEKQAERVLNNDVFQGEETFVDW